MAWAQDVDEFMWAPEHPRLVDYLASLPDRISEVSATELRFGSKGQVTGRITAEACDIAPPVVSVRVPLCAALLLEGRKRGTPGCHKPPQPRPSRR